METKWDAKLYQGKHEFVWQYGKTLLELLAPQSKEYILDLGCGTGQLTQQIANTGAQVKGIDRSSEMIEQAIKNYPHLEFEVADARDFQSDRLFDAVFSNATLHWVKQPEAAIDSLKRCLKPGGRFVAEFGGKGNVKAIAQALELFVPEFNNPWYFPSIGEYTSLLESKGFEVTYAVLFDRPTPLAEGELGLRNWLNMFAGGCLSHLSNQESDRVISGIEKYLKPTLGDRGIWTADYRRLRIVATSPFFLKNLSIFSQQSVKFTDEIVVYEI
jgi:trans-aconitate 2-methyltransferase